jgi:small subunit ribosomal protein S17
MPKKVLDGVVVAKSGDKTISVEVTRTVKHKKYHKIIKTSKKYAVHDEANTCEVGQKVSIQESIPISKRKRFIVLANEKSAQA